MSDRPRIVEGRLWRQEWMRAPADQRARAEAVVRSGTAAEDPRDAALAVGLAIQRRISATWTLVGAAFVAIIFIGFATREGNSSALAGLALVPLIGAGFAHKRRGVALRAELHNREVVYDALAKSAPPPAPDPVSDPWADLPPPPPIEEILPPQPEHGAGPAAPEDAFQAAEPTERTPEAPGS